VSVKVVNYTTTLHQRRLQVAAKTRLRLMWSWVTMTSPWLQSIARESRISGEESDKETSEQVDLSLNRHRLGSSYPTRRADLKPPGLLFFSGLRLFRSRNDDRTGSNTGLRRSV
jgi:hypothetical protein